MSVTNLEAALMGYAIDLLAARLGQAAPSPEQLGELGAARAAKDDAAARLVDYARKLLGEPEGEVAPATRPMRSIFDLVGPSGDGTEVALRRLSLSADTDHGESPEEFFHGFLREIQSIRVGAGTFESFCSLFHVYAWAVPTTLGRNPHTHFEPMGISVAEQFKAVTALAHCMERQDGRTDLLLVSGDVPGIQAMLYTITSRGVAKSLRGRSLYLQLLSDAVVRGLLETLGLPSACTVYNAGGNFKLLVPAASRERLEKFREDINLRLLRLHGGELYVALSWCPISAEAVIDARRPAPEGGLAQALEDLSAKVEVEKTTWFAQAATTDPRLYDALFGPTGGGGPLNSGVPGGATACLVCHADVTEEDRTVGPDREGTYCHQCLSFEPLARDVGRSSYLYVEKIGEEEVVSTGGGTRPVWDVALRRLGFSYRFYETMPQNLAVHNHPAWLYRIDATEDFLGRNGDVRYSVRPIANLTPWETDGQPTIRDTHAMADRDATGVHRYGVLRMDVDRLGLVFQTKLVFKDLLHTSALSAALSLFFEGRLNGICRRAAEEWLSRVETPLATRAEKPSRSGHGNDAKVPYIIYSGGDDLFIVGCWDVLPILAREIRRAFEAFTTGRITMSAGIAIGHDKFPLYQLAEMAKQSLDRSKARQVRDPSGHVQEEKDAITFLGTTLGWEEFHRAEDLTLELARLIATGEDGHKAPRGLLNVLGAVARAYETEGGGARRHGSTTGGIALGRWFWVMTYGLFRMAQRSQGRVRDRIMALIEGWRTEGEEVRGTGGRGIWEMADYLGLPVTWADLLTRKEGDQWQ